MSLAIDKWSARQAARFAASEAARTSEQRGFGGPWGPPWSDQGSGAIPPPWADTSGMATGLSVYGMDELQALQNVTVAACISLLADTVMQLPIDTFRKVDGRRDAIDSPTLIAQPNPEMHDFDFWHRTAQSLVCGNAVLKVLDKDVNGYPTSLLPIHPDDCHARRNRNTNRPEIIISGGYARSPETLTTTGPDRDCVHIPGFTIPGEIMGLSRIGLARLAIFSAQAAEGHGAAWFRDAANPSSVLETDQQVGPSQAEDVQKNWLASHGGRRLPAVLGSGYKWRAITITPEESQFLLTQKWGVTQIARCFRVPPHLVGDVEKSTSWGKGIEEQSLGFLQFSLNPYLIRLERAFSALLPKRQYIKFNVEGLLKARTLDRYQAYVFARNAGWMNVDEIREKEDLPPVPDGKGKEFIQPLNMGPLGTTPAVEPDGDEPTEPQP